MESRRKIIPIIIVVLMAFLLAPQLQSANAGGKSPYESGRDHGCDDAGISDVDDRYINQPEKGPSFHTNEFMKGYHAGYGACSGSEDVYNDNPYCDQANLDERGLREDCFDRKDYSEDTGLYPCKDGSDVKDWRDCPDSEDSNDDEGSADNDSDDLPQDGGCQGEDDYCDSDDGCRSENVDCIDDRNFDEDDYNG